MSRVTIIDNSTNPIITDMSSEEREQIIKIAQVTSLGITNIKKAISKSDGNRLTLADDNLLFVSNNTYLKQNDW